MPSQQKVKESITELQLRKLLYSMGLFQKMHKLHIEDKTMGKDGHPRVLML